MILTGSDTLKQLVVPIDSDRGSPSVTIHVSMVCPLFPVLRYRDLLTNTTRSLIQVVNHITVVVWAIVIIVLVQRALWSGPVNKLGDFLLGSYTSVTAWTGISNIAHYKMCHRYKARWIKWPSGSLLLGLASFSWAKREIVFWLDLWK